MMDVKKFQSLPLMGILRGITERDIEPLLETAVDSGLRAFEITMNTEGAPKLIKKAVRISKGRISVGAGTVLGRGQLEEALDAGAGFIVTPGCDAEVVGECVREGIPVYPGALSPQEVITAWDSGASMVKLFPAGLFGPDYMRDLKGPFDKVRLMAVGGVRESNISEYFAAGASAV
ncbi:MAG: 2-dehydro-3-deoxyphosphogluconate aldolase, partial [Candidatus Omnitrophica bacterium]|nr:2-dehydro-3-deoxyphosphogluconate aldolase [Candidatus Omnitrophota bacterium]